MKRLTITLIGTAMFLADLGLHYVLPRVEVVGVERAWEAASRNVPPVIDAGHEEWLARDRPSSGRPDDPGQRA